MKPGLHELQNWIQWKVLSDPNIPEPQPSCLESIRPEHLEKRLRIYQNAYVLRIADAMAQDFESVRWALGSRAFESLVRRYLRTHPSRSPNIGDVGAALPVFLAEDEQGRELPFLADLARVDWLMIESFYSESAPAPRPDLLAGLAENQLTRVAPVPDRAIRFFTSAWPVIELRKRYDLSKEQGLDEATPEELEVDQTHQTLLVHKNISGTVCLEEISDAQVTVLKALQEGASLGDLFEMNFPVPVLENIPHWLSGWITRGVIRSIRSMPISAR